MNENIPWFLHTIVAFVAFTVFCFAAQQFCGAPTDKMRVLKYRTTVLISSFTSMTLSTAISFNLVIIEQDQSNTISTLNDNFGIFVIVSHVLWIFEALMLGCWLLSRSFYEVIYTQLLDQKVKLICSYNQLTYA